MGFFKDVFGGGGSSPSFNTQELKNTATSGAEKKKKLISGIKPQTDPLSTEFQAANKMATEQAQQRRRALADKFMGDVQKGQSQFGQAQFDKAKQQVLGALPELQRAARENAAATGGLKRGAAAEMVQRPVTEAAATLGTAAGDIALQSQIASQNALDKVFTGDRAFELERLGIDRATAQTLLDAGRTDILQEALGLVGVEDQLTTDLLGIEQMRMEAEAAKEAGKAQRRSALTSALIGAGGMALGGYLGRA